MMKEFKIFVSSTFYDMQVERDLLKNIVKRNLDAKYKGRGVSIDFIDLRWGVNTKNEEEYEKDVLQVCMKEIQKCQPFFIAFLGERYGWIPDRQTKEKGCSFMINEDYDMICQTQDISVTEMEIMFGAFRKNAELDNCIFCFRRIESYDNLKECDKKVYFDNAENIKKLQILKGKIKSRCSEKKVGKIIDYDLPTSMSYQTQLNKLDSLANKIIDTLSCRVDRILQQKDKKNIPNEIEKVNEFITLHNDNYIKRDDMEIQIIESVQLEHDTFNVIHGDSGFGKSYLLSYIYDIISQKMDTIPLFYSTSFSLMRSTSDMVLNSWIIQLSFLTNIRLPEDSLNQNKKEIFSRLVTMTTNKRKRIVLFIDAAEYMEEDELSKNLTFIPDGITVIISVINKNFIDYQYYHNHVRYYKIPNFNYKESQLLLGAILKKAHFKLNKETINDILDKRVDNVYFAYESPLWVYLVANLIVNLDCFDFFATKGAVTHSTSLSGFGKDISTTINTADNYIALLVKKLPSRTEDMLLLTVTKAKSYFGESVVSEYLSLLCMSKYGLTLSDFELLFEAKWDLTLFLKINQWFSSVFYDIRRGGSITFRHNILERSIREQLTKEIKNARYHYIQVMRPILFSQKDIKYDVQFWTEDIQRYNEFIYQLLMTNAYEEVADMCEETENEIVIAEIIREYIKIHEHKLEKRYAPISYRYIDSDFTDLENKLFKMVNLKTCRIDFNDYYWILAYHVGIKLMQMSDGDIALSLFYILSKKLEKLSINENDIFLLENAYNPKTYHNMLVLCYGNISSLYNGIHQYQESLYYLEKRHKAYMELNPMTSETQKMANTGRYHYLYGTIMENMIGEKWKTISHYLEAIQMFSYLDKKEEYFQYQYLYCNALIKVSSWYEKKNDIAKAILYIKDALEKSEKYLDYVDAEYEKYENAKEYFLSVKNLFDICNRHNLDKVEYKVVLLKAWERIQGIYPIRYSDSTFRSLYKYIQEEYVSGNVQQEHSEDELELFEQVFLQAIDANKNKHKNKAIQLFQDAKKIAEILYERNPSSVLKRKLSQVYFNIGLLYRTKSDTSKFLPMSDEYLIKAGELGFYNAYAVLSRNSQKRNDFIKAESFLKIGVSKGSSYCQRDYAICLFEKGEFEEGWKYLEYAIADGDITAKLHKAIFMFNGEYGIEMDKKVQFIY